MVILRYAVPTVAALALGAVAAFNMPAHADPPVNGQSAVVYRTVVETRTVRPRIEGKPIGWWRARAIANRKEANAHKETLRGIGRSLRAGLSLGADGLTRAFLCIHGGEGAWNDPGAPYWGGVQMDRDFMATYGGPFYRAWGTADRWPAFVQIAVAEAAYLSGRGFYPWPNTARACGLL